MSGVRLLLADDTPDVRALLRLVLGRAGYDIVAEARDGAEAVAMAEEHQPDVVIVDLAMPVMDGLEAIPHIRRHAPDAKVVVFSGFTSEGLEAEAMAAGADAYMEKGAPPAKVVATVAGVVGGPAAVRDDIVIVDDDVFGGAGGAGGAGGGGGVGGGGGGGGGGGFAPDDMAFVLHELMSPLTVIEGFAAMIEARGDTLDPAEVKDFGGRIARSAGHLRSLIHAVSDARRVHGGSLRLEPALLDVGVLVAETAADLNGMTSPHPVVVDAAPGHVVRGDVVRLRQVLANLLSNAAKFSDAHELIEVIVAPAGSFVDVVVQDHGPGIAAERRAELFGRYSRLGSAAPGMGIGLYISRGIARAHGGDLRLADSPSGRGARFVLSLPLADADL